MTPIRLLVVDGDDKVLHLCIRCFNGSEFQVVTAAEPELARQILAKERFDILLTDLFTPPLGLNFTREIKTKFPDMDIIAMTAYSTLDTAMNSMKAGAYDYLIKPVDFWMLKAALRRCAVKRILADRVRSSQETLAQLKAVEALLTAAAKGTASAGTKSDMEKVARDLNAALTGLNGVISALTLKSENIRGE